MVAGERQGARARLDRIARLLRTQPLRVIGRLGEIACRVLHERGHGLLAAEASLRHRELCTFCVSVDRGQSPMWQLHQVCSQLHSSPLDQRQPHSARSASAGRKALKKIVGNTLVALTHRAPMTGVLSLATSVWSRLQIAVLR